MAYLVWALVAGISRRTVQDLFNALGQLEKDIPASVTWVKVIFSDAGIAIDVVGLLWLVGSLLLIIFSSRQRCSISWAWVSAICQSFAAGLGAVLVGWAVQQPYFKILELVKPPATTWQQVTGFSVPVAVVIAIVVWTACLTWLLSERARLNRHGPTLRDGLRSNVYR